MKVQQAARNIRIRHQASVAVQTSGRTRPLQGVMNDQEACVSAQM